MQPERVERIKFLLATALAKPLEERAAYLDNACAGDLGLRRDVEQYLNSSDKTEKFVFHADVTQPTLGPALPFLTDPRIGKEFGKYVIRKRLAEGGMGIVYLAMDKQLGREVALKILPENFSVDKERLERFHREARATSFLNHPNIVTVFELGQMEGCEFIVTEFVEGETLREKMSRGPLPFVEILKISSQVAMALSAAHKAGIIHRDIKPENVMIRPDGYVKVLDFGLAKLSDATGKAISGNLGISQHNRTVPGVIMGTAAYLSPEQADGRDIDGRTDIWALGVMLYEMAAGKLPFDGPTASHTIVAILEHDPKPFDHPSTELKQIIATALQKDRQLRFQTADAMSEALDGLKQRLGYVSDQNLAPPSISDRKAAADETKSGSRTWLWLLPTAFAVLLIGILGIFGIGLLLSGDWSSNTDNRSVIDAEPSPTVEAVTATPLPVAATPESSPGAIYVDPTPELIPDETEKRPDPRPTVQAQRTPVPVEPKRTPVVVKPKPRPTQDPNCVFTNTCH